MGRPGPRPVLRVGVTLGDVAVPLLDTQLAFLHRLAHGNILSAAVTGARDPPPTAPPVGMGRGRVRWFAEKPFQKSTQNARNKLGP